MTSHGRLTGAAQRTAFQATVDQHRAEVRTDWNFAADEPLTHYQAAAVDRRAVRDALVAHELLRILPRRRRASVSESCTAQVQRAQSAGRMELAQVIASSIVDEATDRESHVVSPIRNQSEEAHYSTNKLSASGKN